MSLGNTAHETFCSQAGLVKFTKQRNQIKVLESDREGSNLILINLVLPEWSVGLDWIGRRGVLL